MKDYHRTIGFTRVPLKGKFRYRDIFQIFPANLCNQPYSVHQRHHPIILEFWTNSEEKVNISSEYPELSELYSSTAKIVSKQDTYFSLLSVFSNNMFFRYSDLKGRWGIPILKDDPYDEGNQWRSQWCMSLYHFPELPNQMSINNFTEIELNDVKRLPHKFYYTNEPNLDSDSNIEINFPESLEKILDAYFLLDPEARSIVETAISYSVSAMELKDTKSTLSLLSSFTSLETMINLEFQDLKPMNCKECGQLQYNISKKFRDFLLKYIGNNDFNKKKFNSYYSFRSKIVHTGSRLKSEKLFSEIPEDVQASEYLTHMEILQLGKLAIINWLLNEPLKL